MSAEKSRYILWGSIGSLFMLGVLFAFWPRPVLVTMEQVAKDSITVTVREEAKTRIHDLFVLSSPVTGYLRRITAEVGDEVQGTTSIVAEIEPMDPSFLDPRSEAQAIAVVQAAIAAERLAEAEVEQVEAELEFAQSELKRMRELFQNNSVSVRELDNAERQQKTLVATLATAQASLQMREFEHQRAQAQLMSPVITQNNHGHCECLIIRAPISGKILKVINQSEGVVNVGTPLVEIGDPKDLEIVVELLSFDAVKVLPGQRVIIHNWGGDKPLQGQVSKIEPIGFTKVSALGIEEQRVNVIVALQSEFEQWFRLGHGYQLDVDIVLWENSDVIAIPLTALFRVGEDWAIYVVVKERAIQRVVKVGQRNTFKAEILSGLEVGEWLIPHPNDQIAEGIMVSQL